MKAMSKLIDIAFIFFIILIYNVEYFAKGMVKMVQLKVGEGMPII